MQTRFIWVIFLFFLGTCAECNAAVSPVEDRWDFQKVTKGEIKEKQFRIENTSTKTVTIEKIHACCGYSVGDVSSWIIQPEAVITLKVACDATRKAPGQDKKFITLVLDDEVNTELKIAVFAYVVEKSKNPAAKPVLSQPPQVPSINAQGLFTQILDNDKLVILDVREESEYSRKYIPNSINLPRSEFGWGNPRTQELVADIDKNSFIVVYCGGGIRSNYMARKLKDAGYNAFNLIGGISTWEKEHYPLLLGEPIPACAEPLPINLEEAYEHYFLLFKDKTVWVDARDEEDYNQGHIKGAVNVPLSELKDRLQFLSKDKEIVLYCESLSCTQSTEAGRILIENGFKQGKIKVFTEGYNAWKEAAYPTE